VRQRLEIETAGDRHHRDQQLVFLAAGQQCLEYAGRLEPQFLGSLEPVGGGLRIMLVAVDTVLGLGLLQQIDGRCHGS